MKNSWIFLIVIFLAGGLAGYFFGFDHGFERAAQQPKETLISLVGAGNSSELKYYWNDKYNFDFQYPAAWDIRETYYPDQAFMAEPWSSLEFFITIEEPNAQDHSGFIGVSKKSPEEIARVLKEFPGDYNVKTLAANGYTYVLDGNANGALGASPNAAKAIKTVFDSFHLTGPETDSE